MSIPCGDPTRIRVERCWPRSWPRVNVVRIALSVRDFGSCLLFSRASSVSSGVSLLTHLTHSLCSNEPLPQQRAPIQLELLDDGVPGDRTRSTRVTGARPPSRAGKGRGRHREQVAEARPHAARRRARSRAHRSRIAWSLSTPRFGPGLVDIGWPPRHGLTSTSGGHHDIGWPPRHRCVVAVLGLRENTA